MRIKQKQKQHHKKIFPSKEWCIDEISYSSQYSPRDGIGKHAPRKLKWIIDFHGKISNFSCQRNNWFSTSIKRAHSTGFALQEKSQNSKNRQNAAILKKNMLRQAYYSLNSQWFLQFHSNIIKMNMIVCIPTIQNILDSLIQGIPVVTKHKTQL